VNPIVAIPVLGDTPGVQLPHPLTKRAVRRGAGVALRSIDLAELRPVVDTFLRDRRLSAAQVGRIARELLAEHGFTAGEEVPARDYERILTAAMKSRRGRLPL
jgi:hypothetical protein